MPVTNYYTVGGEIIGEKTTGGSRIDYLTDALGSVTATMDQTGSVVNTYRYKPYGGQLAKTGVGADPSFRWVGAQGYRQTGKKYSDVYVRARHYDTAGGRWTSRDPYWPYVNPYHLVKNRVITVCDPTGQDPAILPGGPSNPNLGGHDCGLWPGGVCDYFRKHPPPPNPAELNPPIGYVVCCNGKYTPCSDFQKRPFDIYFRFIDECLLEHERRHIDQGLKPCGPCDFRRASLFWGGSQDIKQWSECEGYVVQAKCLLSNGPRLCQGYGTSGDEECRRLHHEFFCDACDNINLNCKLYQNRDVVTIGNRPSTLAQECLRICKLGRLGRPPGGNRLLR